MMNYTNPSTDEDDDDQSRKPPSSGKKRGPTDDEEPDRHKRTTTDDTNQASIDQIESLRNISTILQGLPTDERQRFLSNIPGSLREQDALWSAVAQIRNVNQSNNDNSMTGSPAALPVLLQELENQKRLQLLRDAHALEQARMDQNRQILEALKSQSSARASSVDPQQNLLDTLFNNDQNSQAHSVQGQTPNTELLLRQLPANQQQSSQIQQILNSAFPSRSQTSGQQQASSSSSDNQSPSIAMLRQILQKQRDDELLAKQRLEEEQREQHRLASAQQNVNMLQGILARLNGGASNSPQTYPSVASLPRQEQAGSAGITDPNSLLLALQSLQRQGQTLPTSNTATLPNTAQIPTTGQSTSGLRTPLLDSFVELQQQQQQDVTSAHSEPINNHDEIQALMAKLDRASQRGEGIDGFVPGIPLALPSDTGRLSGYQIFVRRSLEFFVAQQDDVDTNVQGRKKQVQLGQVGIRCRHCADIPVRQRGRGSVYYPQKLSGVYQAAQNMATTHLSSSCLSIPDPIREELNNLRKRRDTASGGKAYWADACRKIGLVEEETGIHFATDKMKKSTPKEDR